MRFVEGAKRPRFALIRVSFFLSCPLTTQPENNFQKKTPEKNPIKYFRHSTVMFFVQCIRCFPWEEIRSMTKVKWQETNKGATPRLPPQTAEPFGQELLSVPPQIRCIVPSLTGTAPDDRLNPVSGRAPPPGQAARGGQLQIRGPVIFSEFPETGKLR